MGPAAGSFHRSRVVLEKAGNLSVVRFSGHWSDLGGWDAVWREIQNAASPSHGAVTDPRSTAIDCDNVLLRSQDEGIEVVGIGLRDVSGGGHQ